jgi:hypothetical protein
MSAGCAKVRFVISASVKRAVALGMLVALVALAISVAPASALPLPPLQINGAATGSSGPQVNATLDSQGADGEGGALYILTLSFPSSNEVGDEITAVSGTFNAAEANAHGFVSVEEAVGNADPGALFSVFANSAQCFTPGGTRQSFTCPNFFGGFGPGAQQSYVIDTNQNQNDPTPLSSVNVTVALCGQNSSAAMIAAARCVPPGPTKITKAKIDQHARTASFQYAAKHAMHYECELVFNKAVEHRAPCGSAKKYHGPLAAGKYAFIVWGVNAGGGSATAAKKKFTIA